MLFKTLINFQRNRHFEKNYFCPKQTWGMTNEKAGLKTLMYRKKGGALGKVRVWLKYYLTS